MTPAETKQFFSSDCCFENSAFEFFLKHDTTTCKLTSINICTHPTSTSISISGRLNCQILETDEVTTVVLLSTATLLSKGTVYTSIRSESKRQVPAQENLTDELRSIRVFEIKGAQDKDKRKRLSPSYILLALIRE